MTDYLAPDKVEDDEWSPDEHNQMKSALNSKQDKSNLVTDFSTPSNTTYPSTSAVNTLVAISTQVMYRGELTGTEDLATKNIPGCWMPGSGFNPTHASYPVTAKGSLVVFANSNYLVQIYYVFASTNGGYTRTFVRTAQTGSSIWGAWTEDLTKNYIKQDISSPNTTDVLSTQGIVDFLGDVVSILGDLNSSDDLDGKKVPGCWVPGGNFSSYDSSFPIQEKGILEVLSDGEYVIQRYTVIGTESIKPVCYYRTHYMVDDTTDYWTNWEQIVVTSWLPDQYKPKTPSGSPSINLTSAPGYSIELTSDSTDTDGIFTITRVGGEAVATLQINLGFLHLAGLAPISINLTPRSEKSYDNKWWVSDMTSSGVTIHVQGALETSETSSFYYSISIK